jgi:glycerol-3-phosphate O-acyltransferase
VSTEVATPERSPETPATVYLLHATSAAEHRLLEEWVAGRRAASADEPVESLVVGPDDTGDLEARLRRGDDPVLQPVRVGWRPKERNGARAARIRDVLLIGDPRRPRIAAQDLILRRDPGRAEVVSGRPASLSELRALFEREGAGDDDVAFARFVARRATLALEREETHLLGPQYKVPGLVREAILGSGRFGAGVARLAAETGKSEEETRRAAAACLDEMVAGYGRSQIDLTLELGRGIGRYGYDEELDVDREQAERMVAKVRNASAVLLPSHRSNFDSIVIPNAWHDLGLPPTHTLGGDNMAFWPVGPIMRRSGTIFIRRDTKSDPIYRFVLREYVGYLVEKRFPLEWYIEGGRSRTGKMLPPKLGLLTYVVDAYLEGRTEDVVLVPASITYDQLREVADFAGEARGEAKQKESIGWLWSSTRRSAQRYGKVYVRFGEPVSLRAVLGPPADTGPVDAEERSLTLNKLAFEVATRINDVTPITASSLLTMALLAVLGRAMTFDQVRTAVRWQLGDAARRGLPLTSSARALETDGGLEAALDALVDNEVVVRFDGGPDTVYLLGPDQHLAAAFYRNSIIHHFLESTIAQLALVSAAEPGVEDPTDAVWAATLRLRDLLKFEFFFRDRDAFRGAVQAELDRARPGWEEAVAQGPEGIAGLHPDIPLTAHLMLRSFLEAYSVVALALQQRGSAPVTDTDAFLTACDGLGRQHLLQQRIRSPESVSKPLFANGLKLAENLGLTEPASVARTAEPDDLAERRTAFAQELRHLLQQLDGIEALALDGLRDALVTSRGDEP